MVSTAYCTPGMPTRSPLQIPSVLTTPCISRESHSSSTYLSCKSLILCNDTHRKPGKMLLCDVAPLRERAYSRMIRRSAGFISGRAGSASSSEGWYHCMVTSVSVLNRTTLSDGLCGSGVLPGGGGTLGCRQQMSNGLTVSVCLWLQLPSNSIKFKGTSAWSKVQCMQVKSEIESVFTKSVKWKV